MLKVSNITASSQRFSRLKINRKLRDDWVQVSLRTPNAKSYDVIVIWWLFLSTLSLGNSSTSKNNNTKWIREELHVFFTPSSRGSFKRCISRSPPTNVARGFESWHWRHMWIVVGFLPCSETFFSGYFDSVSPLLKNQHFQFQFDLERADTFPRVLKKS